MGCTLSPHDFQLEKSDTVLLPRLLLTRLAGSHTNQEMGQDFVKDSELLMVTATCYKLVGCESCPGRKGEAFISRS